MLDGKKATGDNPIQEPRTRMNRYTKVTESKESTGSEQETSIVEGKEETDSEKDQDGKEEEATLTKNATTSAPKLVKGDKQHWHIACSRSHCHW